MGYRLQRWAVRLVEFGRTTPIREPVLVSSWYDDLEEAAWELKRRRLDPDEPDRLGLVEDTLFGPRPVSTGADEMTVNRICDPQVTLESRWE